MTNQMIGVSLAVVNSDMNKAGGGGGGFHLNNRHSDEAGGEWHFVKASVAFTLGDCVLIKASGSARPILAADADQGGKIGFAQVAFTLDYYGWVKTNGAVTFRIAASCAKDVQLYVTSTAGVLDDASASHEIIGIVASQSGTSGVTPAAGFASYPMVKQAGPDS